MGRKLTRLNYEKQIIDLEWRRTSAVCREKQFKNSSLLYRCCTLDATPSPWIIRAMVADL